MTWKPKRACGHKLDPRCILQVLAPVVGNDVIVKTILPAVLTLANDNVPNVRFNVAKTLELLINNMTDKAVVAEQIVPVLNQLKDDQDRDVKYFAHKALAAGKLPDVAIPLARLCPFLKHHGVRCLSTIGSVA